jgi:hypothetical protein
LIGDPKLPDSERRLARWFNTAAFAAPAAYTFVSAPRSLGAVRSDGIRALIFPSSKTRSFMKTCDCNFAPNFST